MKRTNLVEQPQPPPAITLMLNDNLMISRERITLIVDIIYLSSTKAHGRVPLFTKKYIKIFKKSNISESVESAVGAKIDELVTAYPDSEIVLEMHYCNESTESLRKKTRTEYLSILQDIVLALEKKAILEDIKVEFRNDDYDIPCIRTPCIRRVK